ncbi:MAG TPA: hypothetical protein VJU79_01925 [Candidatus Dormibacteraeota bacterium]|nr:hypothetical protein [Candidatus Dormibacteraeota bacterium]
MSEEARARSATYPFEVHADSRLATVGSLALASEKYASTPM